ncbi:MAG: bifunctional 3-phosphoshikimate 1-carboxyvinyltransferase/cytidylate kinase [Betaproteobacteria bacterium]|nr:bifunctional 3-phosphoshikimate 1-carboxyvinyltransferase/cytidylate kinase [Betaproteobacteria bacterium]
MTHPDHLDLPPLIGARGAVHLPGSKSISNRVLLLAALADGSTELSGLLDSDDTRVMLDALRALGVRVDGSPGDAGRPVVVHGCGARLPHDSADLFLGNAGTAVRPLTAALALLGGDYTVRGVPRMHERPIGDLVDALRAIGCAIDYRGNPGYPPLAIGRGRPSVDAPLRVRGDVSSQFLTALLLSLPLLGSACDIEVQVEGTLISRPYVALTLAMLERFGVQVRNDAWQRFVVPAGARLRSPGRLRVEGDASSASYFLAAGVLGGLHGRGGPVRVHGVDAQSLQGDVEFARVLERLGGQLTWGDGWIDACGLQPGRHRLAGGDIDCLAIPDAAMTLAVTALFADAPTRLGGIASWRVKETDRIHAMLTELRRLGARAEAGDDWLRVWPMDDADWRAASIRTYDDHRMAMCFSLASFGPVDLRIEDPGCVAKTFPAYFDAFAGVARPVPVLAIDGPTASGKGTLAACVAGTLGFHVLDSGSLYRATALRALRLGVALDDEPRLSELAAGLPVTWRDGAVLLDGEDVSVELRSERVGNAASTIAPLPRLRDALLGLQRAQRRAPGLVADGRDMGSVVFPDARLKVFLTASAETRAERRYKQLISLGISTTLDDVLRDLRARDARDASRSVAAMAAAQDALPLDNAQLDVDTTAARVLQWWRERT